MGSLFESSNIFMGISNAILYIYRSSLVLIGYFSIALAFLLNVQDMK
jgi:hypothetical protein